MVDVQQAISRAHREEWARVVAALTRRFGDLDIAEEAAAEAFATAAERWSADGVPSNPGGWLTTTARRMAIERIRRENKNGLATGSTGAVRKLGRPTAKRSRPSSRSSAAGRSAT